MRYNAEDHALYGQVSKRLVWHKQVSKGLKTKSKGLASTKELAMCVRNAHTPTCTVLPGTRGCLQNMPYLLTRCSTKTVPPAFARCPPFLTSLDTLHILHAYSQMTTIIQHACKSRTLPSIRTVVLASCPALTTFSGTAPRSAR